MALLFLVFLFSSLFLFDVTGLQYTASEVEYNLNTNVDATHPLDYSGTWENHTFNPSPSTWRFPFYVITLDRFIDGDPTNNDANNTNFENFWMTNQYRFGGDLKGLESHLDYLQGMGIKVRHTGSSVLKGLTNSSRHCILPELPLSTCHGRVTAMDLWISLY